MHNASSWSNESWAGSNKKRKPGEGEGASAMLGAARSSATWIISAVAPSGLPRLVQIEQQQQVNE